MLGSGQELDSSLGHQSALPAAGPSLTMNFTFPILKLRLYNYYMYFIEWHQGKGAIEM